MGEVTKLQPDLDFIRYLKTAGGDTLKKCYQCATCSVMCPLAKDGKPFPRKEMIWAQWGLKDKLMADPDVLLCHQCGDCTAKCPRGAKPGDVLGAIRAYAYLHYAYPQGLAKFVSQPKNLPVLIGAPALVIFLMLAVTGHLTIPEKPIDFGKFMNVLMIDAIFVPAFLFAGYAIFRGAANMWRNMSAGLSTNSQFRPSAVTFVKDFVWPALFESIQHKRFNECGENKDRVKGHLPLLLSFIGLFIVTNYGMVRKDILGLIFPSLHGPIPLYDPFKMLANVSAIALIIGIVILWSNRKQMEDENGTKATFYDWFLIYEIMAVGITGLGAELLRLIGWAGPAYLVYFFHLVAVLMLFLYLPYTKLAHLVYRTTAMAFERYRVSRFVGA